MAGTEQPELLIFAALLVTAIWYACSTSITLFSKKWLNEYDFSYPFFIVAYEDSVCAVLAFNSA